MLSYMHVSSSLNALHTLCWLSLVAACIAVTALFPLFVGPVPITFQDCVIMGAGFLLGPKEGAKAVLLYIVAGCIGLPVFSGGRSGLAHVFGPTGGYLIGFVFLAYFSGLSMRWYTTAQTKWTQRGSLFIGWLIGYSLVYAIGAFWLVHTMNISYTTAFAVGVFPFLPITVIKLLVLFASFRPLYPQIKRFSPHAKRAY